MTRPPRLPLDLALALHAGRPPAVQDQHAEWAARLGYAEVWLPVGRGIGPPSPARLAELAGFGPRLGLLVSWTNADLVTGLLELPVDFLLELSGDRREVPELLSPALRARLRDQWVHPPLPSFRNRIDPALAGTVVLAPTRADLVAGVGAAVAARRAAGVTAHPVFAALSAAIGRTRNEAVARAARDRRVLSVERAGLFGTYEQAQSQVLDLAAAGADGLRLTVADEIDAADLLAQIRAVVVAALPAPHARRG